MTVKKYCQWQFAAAGWVLCLTAVFKKLILNQRSTIPFADPTDWYGYCALHLRACIARLALSGDIQ